MSARKISMMLTLAASVFMTAGEVIADPMGTAFTYQGFLTDNGAPADGEYDFRFRLCSDSACTGQVGDPIPIENHPVIHGLFTVELDFGEGVFTGDARWLEIGVRPGDSTEDYAILAPPQELTPAPYALALPGLWTQQQEDPNFAPNLIGGHAGNEVTAGVIGATISGGGGTVIRNRVCDQYGTVGGGADNRAGVDDGNLWFQGYATVGGGWDNNATDAYVTVGGGHSNNASGEASTVGGGKSNEATDDYATVGGGYDNAASGDSSTVPGGYNNTAGGDYSFAAGRQATIDAAHHGTFVWADHTAADFASTDEDQFLIRASGGVGIGTTAPTAQLHVSGSGPFTKLSTFAYGTETVIGNTAVAIGTAHNAKHGLSIRTKNNQNGDTNHASLWIENVGDGGLVVYAKGKAGPDNPTPFVIDHYGKVGIGTPEPDEALHVCGNIVATGYMKCPGDFIVGPVDCPPDYVFEKDYSLMPLDELREFVTREKHLPNVPSAAEIERDGVNLGEFQMRVLEKVEELTLYNLQQHETIEGQKKEISDLTSRLARMEAIVVELTSVRDGGAR